MRISTLRTSFFRNMADAENATNAKNIFLLGKNGQGKTNFLEALYFCSYASSFRGARDMDMARNAVSDFSTEVTMVDGDHDSIFVKVQRGRKYIYLDKKPIDRKDLLSVLPAIAFCHEDLDFIQGSPERRRWFFDQNLSLIDPIYLDDLRSYRKVLKSRNLVLRSARESGFGVRPEEAAVLDTLEAQMVQYGMSLMEKRRAETVEISSVLGFLCKEIAGIDNLGLEYRPSWFTGGADDVRCYLAGTRQRECMTGLTFSGPHRDRYLFLQNGALFDEKASMGQRRLLALLLRVCQARRYSEVNGKKPLLLLDDVMLELDGETRERFIENMPPYDQAFFTFLPEEPYTRYGDGDETIVYNVENGIYTTVSTDAAG
jgi:DNA replication and repair protein RecF